MNTQAKFLQMLRTSTEARGLQFINDTDWANTGTVRIQAAGNFGDIVKLRYDFQSGYASFSLNGREGPGLSYVKTDELQTVLNMVEAIIPSFYKREARAAQVASVLDWCHENINANASEWDVGGGCTAIGIPRDGGGHWLITEEGDPEMPKSLTEPVVVGLYGKDVDQWVQFKCADLSKAAELIESFSATSL